MARLILEDENQQEFKDSVGSDADENMCLHPAELSKKRNKVCSIVVGVVTLDRKQGSSLEGFLSHMSPFCYSGATGHANNGVPKITCNSGTTAPSQVLAL